MRTHTADSKGAQMQGMAALPPPLIGQASGVDTDPPRKKKAPRPST